MFLFLPKAGRLLPAFIIALLTLCPLFSQEKITGVEDDADIGPIFDEDILLLEGEGITVTGSPETTQQMKVVTKEEIERHNAPDLATLLQETLNLGVTGYGGYGSQTGINMRGFDSERIAFLIDGIPANSTMTGDFDLSQLDLNAIERIEIIYGGSDTKYNVSGALGGVINIITAKKNKPGWRIGGSISNTSAIPGEYQKRSGGTGNPQWQDLVDTQNIALSTAFGSEKFSWSFNQFANRAGNHFLYTDYTDTVRRNESNEVWDTGASTSFIWNLPDTYSKLIASADLYYGDKNIPTKRGSSDVGKQTDFSTRQNIMLDMPRVGRDDLATEVSLSHAWQTLEYEPPAGSSSLHDQQVITAINRWTWYPRSWLTLRSGWDYRFNYLDSTDIGLRSRHDGGLYLTVEYKAHEKFLIIPSVKAVFSGPSEKPVVPVPKLGFLWKPLESLTLKNNYFRSFKYPDFEDLYWGGDALTQGNPDLKPEDGFGGDLGAAWQYGNWVGIESTFFTQWTTDSIHWSSGAGGVWRPENVGEALYFGLDSKVRGEIPLSAGPFRTIGLSLSYQYLLSYLLSYGYDFASDKRIPYMPMHTIGASLDFAWGAKDSRAGSLLITGHYEGLRFAERSNITELDPYFLLSVNVNQQIGGNLTAFAVVRNLLNTSYESFDDYPMPGITVTLGMRFTIEPLKEKK
ncbi:MAG: TonB-dependent receptor [Treponema sp.]|nr:TonB-dependent receptor [Treponema sp.]